MALPKLTPVPTLATAPAPQAAPPALTVAPEPALSDSADADAEETLPEAPPSPAAVTRPAPVAKSSPVAAPVVALAIPRQQPPAAPLVLSGDFAPDAAQLQAAFAASGIDLGESLGLMNLGGALDSLGSRIPVLAIEYLAKKEAKDLGLVKGSWTFRHTMEQAETVRAIFAAAKLQRVWREKYDPKADEQPAPWCFSRDGQTPSPDGGTRPQRGPCASCPKAKWGRDANGKRTPPECGENQLVLILVRDFDEQTQVQPMVCTFKRTSLGPYRLAMDTVRGRSLQWGREFPPAMRHLSVEFTLGVADEQTYYKPTFGQFGPVTPTEGAQLAQIVAATLPSFKDLDLLQLDAEDVDADDSTPFDSPAPQSAQGSTSTPAAPRRF